MSDEEQRLERWYVTDTWSRDVAEEYDDWDYYEETRNIPWYEQEWYEERLPKKSKPKEWALMASNGSRWEIWRKYHSKRDAEIGLRHMLYKATQPYRDYLLKMKFKVVKCKEK